MNNDLPVSIIIFGASGDLTQRKLIPSFLNLSRKGRLPKTFSIIGFGATAFTDEQFRDHLQNGATQFAGFKFTDEEWSAFAPHLFYQQGRYDQTADFENLAKRLGELETETTNRLYYMAIPPTLFPNIIEQLGITGQLHENGGWRRVVLEKPFGTNLASAEKLNLQVHKGLNENQIYRIDHYQ